MLIDIFINTSHFLDNQILDEYFINVYSIFFAQKPTNTCTRANYLIYFEFHVSLMFIEMEKLFLSVCLLCIYLNIYII